MSTTRSGLCLEYRWKEGYSYRQRLCYEYEIYTQRICDGTMLSWLGLAMRHYQVILAHGGKISAEAAHVWICHRHEVTKTPRLGWVMIWNLILVVDTNWHNWCFVWVSVSTRIRKILTQWQSHSDTSPPAAFEFRSTAIFIHVIHFWSPLLYSVAGINGADGTPKVESTSQPSTGDAWRNVRAPERRSRQSWALNCRKQRE